MSIRDPFYRDIEEALAQTRLDPDLFERLAAGLVESKGYPTNLVDGGADNGYDFEIVDASLEPGPGIVTTSANVIGNLRRNLARNKANCPTAARKTYVVTSARLTPRRRDNLKTAAAEIGYTLLGIADRSEVVRYIYANPGWALDLLGLTGQPAALSPVPRFSRPLIDIPLVGRENIAERLRNLDRDAMLIGSPGAGKTSLLTGLVDDGLGSFMVSTDMGAVANAVRQQKPRFIIVDDLADIVTATRDLVRLRAELSAEFAIIVVDWEVNPEVCQLLGLNDGQVLPLQQLTRDQIVEVVGALGVAGPPELIREIVNQAEGIPGLAVTLTQAALAGDYRSVLDGNSLGTIIESTVNRLLGDPAAGDRAVLSLGCIALAGDSGLFLEEISDYVGLGKHEIQGLLRRLTTAGILRSHSRRVTLRPRALRGYMIRKAFFGVGAADYTLLLEKMPNIGHTVQELVLAVRVGADIPSLLELVVSSRDVMAARYLVGTGEHQARRFLEAAPELAVDVSQEALHMAPDIIIPMLLDHAVGDHRELHSNPRHPIRLIREWANSVKPGIGQAINRKHVVISSALRWAHRGNDFVTAIRVCSEVIRTTFEGMETDPGSGTKVTLMRAVLTDEEIEDLFPLWVEVREAVEEEGDAPWMSLLEMCWALINPELFGDSSPERLESSHRLGAQIIGDIATLASAHPGVLERLNGMLKYLGSAQIYEIPDDYVVLWGELDRKDWKNAEKKRTKDIKELAEGWATEDPGAIATRIAWLHQQAANVGRSPHGQMPFLCHLLSQRVGEPEQWMKHLVARRLPANCVLPFLDRVVSERSGNWETVVLPLLDDEVVEPAAIELALRQPRISEELWLILNRKLVANVHLLNRVSFRDQIPSETLGRLLRHDSELVVRATALAMWTGDSIDVIPAMLRDDWERAIVAVDSDDYRLEDILGSDSELAYRWLTERIASNDWRMLSRTHYVQAASRHLTDEQRFQLLKSSAKISIRCGLAVALIGSSEEMFRRVLREPAFGGVWRAPLQSDPDGAWRRWVSIALEQGKTPYEIVSATIPMSDSWSGPESEHVQARIEAFASWLDDSNLGVRDVADRVIEWLSDRKAKAQMREQNEAVYGLD